MVRKNRNRKGPKWQNKAKSKRPLIVKHTQTIVVPQNLETIAKPPIKASSLHKLLFAPINNLKHAMFMHIIFALTYGFLITQVIYDGVNGEGYSFYRLSFSQASILFVKISFFIALLVLASWIAIYLVNKTFDNKTRLLKVYIRYAQSLSVSWILCVIMGIIALFDPGTHIGLAMVLFVLTCFGGMLTIQMDDEQNQDKKILGLIAATAVIFVLFTIFLTLFSSEFLRLFAF